MRRHIINSVTISLFLTATGVAAERVVWETDFDENISYNFRHCFNESCEEDDLLTDILLAPQEFTDANDNALVVVLTDPSGARWGSMEPEGSMNIEIPSNAIGFTYSYSFYIPPEDGFDAGEDFIGNGALRWNSSPETTPNNNADGFPTSFLGGQSTETGVTVTNTHEGVIPTDENGNLPTHVLPLIGFWNASVAGSGSNRVGIFGYIDNVKLTFEVEGVDLTCDFNGDGVCDIADIDELTTTISAGTNDPAFDLNADTLVSDADRDVWLANAATANGFASPYLLGDADLDGIVGTSDLNRVGIRWQDASATKWSEGNFVSEGQPGVNTADLNAVGLNWQASNMAAAAVPEPESHWMALVALIVPATLRRRLDRKPTHEGLSI